MGALGDCRSSARASSRVLRPPTRTSWLREIWWKFLRSLLIMIQTIGAPVAQLAEILIYAHEQREKKRNLHGSNTHMRTKVGEFHLTTLSKYPVV
ncbi:hypothetical protein M408DRAFT_295846 [Serendipita vermifera MAFF 305830]|uniref:Uncharacterized protein n=1 Tax=Serendipita vermifera MAFF 305830 TaxID=933852 RepID=A0A0C2XMR6_SERVB|nr:hypothetical protein M408DRAFT_295846 [Serendipita vermifera MAFF 305830]